MEKEESLFSVFKKDLTVNHLGSLNLMKRKNVVALVIAHDFWIFNNLWPHRLRDVHVFTCFFISLFIDVFCYFFSSVMFIFKVPFFTLWLLCALLNAATMLFSLIFEKWKKAVHSPRKPNLTHIFHCACALAPLDAEFPHAHTRLTFSCVFPLFHDRQTPSSLSIKQRTNGHNSPNGKPPCMAAQLNHTNQ